MYQNLFNKEIKNIIRKDEFGEYEFYGPLGLYFDLGQEIGLYFGITNDKTIIIDLLTWKELNEISSFENSECDLNELDEKDELKKLIGQRITDIKIAENKDLTIKGETFELLLGGYAGVKLQTQDNELVFYNQNGGRLFLNDGDKLPDKERWTWK